MTRGPERLVVGVPVSACPLTGGEFKLDQVFFDFYDPPLSHVFIGVLALVFDLRLDPARRAEDVRAVQEVKLDDLAV